MPRKRTALDKEISRLEKNARNKLYRLRKRGATNTADYSPLYSGGERIDVSVMNGSQKAAYARRLKAFNSRSNAFDVAPSGQALSRERVREYRRAASELTALRQRDAQRIADSAAKVMRALRARAEKASADEKRRREWYAKHGSYRGREYAVKPSNRRAIEAWQAFKAQMPEAREAMRAFDPVVPAELPSSPERLERLIGALKSASEKRKRRTSASRDKDWKRGVSARLKEHGYSDVADGWESLTRAQREWLHYYTDFSALASQFRYQSEYEKGETYMPEDVTADAAAQMLELIRIAKSSR